MKGQTDHSPVVEQGFTQKLSISMNCGGGVGREETHRDLVNAGQAGRGSRQEVPPSQATK